MARWRSVPYLLAVPLVAGQACREAAYAWCTQPYYYSSDSLPPTGTSSCCGSQLVGDPSVADVGFSCLCDLTAGACDEGCCCDRDCSFDELRYDGIFQCVSNDTATAQRGYTLCSDNLVATNIPAEVREQGLVTAFGGADGLLCVITDNSPARGAFFRDPVGTTALTAQQVLAEIDAAMPIQYGTVWLAPTSSVVPSTYELDAPLLGDGCIYAVGSAGCARLAPVLLPAPDATGGCSSHQSVPFLRDIAPFHCRPLPAALATAAASSPAARVALMESLCATVLNATFVNRATFKTAPSATASEAQIVMNLRDLNSTTSGYVTVSDLPSSVWDAGTESCLSALTSYELQVATTGAGTVTTVAYYLKTEVVTAAQLPTLRTSYAAAFVPDTAPSDPVRPTSGRPGYQRGLPLLVAEGQSIRTDGLRMLPRTPVGGCSSGPGGATTVNFGEDMALSCTYTYSAAEFEAMCSAGTALSSQPAFATLNMSETSSLMGVFGDSHPSIDTDWVPILLRYPQNDAAQLVTSWSSSSYECSNVLSGVHLRVLYTDVGSTSAPVSKVVGAEVLFTERTVAAARNALGLAASTTVTITATATFAKLDAESFEFIPPAPQLIPPLPHDFFYPFTAPYTAETTSAV